jgi:hypothetical protein
MAFRSLGRGIVRSQTGRLLALRAVRRATLAVALLPVVLELAGCFDVHSIGPGPYVIDDFENGTVQPLDPLFGGWFCGGYNPPTNKNISCGLGYGDNSNNALNLTFTIVDPMNGVQDHGGALLETMTLFPGDVRDFSKFSELVVDVQMVPGNPTLPSTAILYVQFGCSTVPAADGSLPGNLYVVVSAPYSSTWTTVSLPISGFASPSWVRTKIMGGAEACLERVDNISFDVDAQLPDGAIGMGTLSIDDIYLQ